MLPAVPARVAVLLKIYAHCAVQPCPHITKRVADEDRVSLEESEGLR
jgi:hypothetical protein